MSSILKNISGSSLLGNKYIRVTLLATLFSQFGVWIRNFAVLMFIMEHTNNDPVAVSWIYIAEYVPIFIFSFVGGTFADRWPPRKTIIICDTLSALSVLGILMALLGGTWKMIFCTTLLSAVFSQFSQPSGMKLFKMHVPENQVKSAMALNQVL